MLPARFVPTRRAPRRNTWKDVSRLYTSSDSSVEETRQHLRELLRETAQSVAVVTSLLPTAESNNPQHPHSPTPRPAYHGATLSSFTSIALDPLPLVAFSLRVPSRMASALRTRADKYKALTAAHLVINVLSAIQPHLAERFARPDLYSRPFEDSEVHWTPSEDGLPIISGALGALSCSLVGPPLPLTDLRWMGKKPMSDGNVEAQELAGGGGLASELFIARVLRIERVPPPESDGNDDGLRTLPLLYHRRQYATVCDLEKP
ncbi:hypothetical protein PAXRUDRAFT_828703 [Paxillus rubicundulus Ve08.2h10]|uniref:Flavin reductase like domain-containing protein n=1 Tax=Paxillus rubicundulus Ve08.2h10 TaxID=930991 RepID=A0A0D0DVR7_9AGAM|nr:hypothetical protein PAXRUDRAFT_828703 [Paxillus rubicundulus Ve08.2h10]